MIGSFADRRSMALYNGKTVPAWRSFRRQAIRRLEILDNATSLNDLRMLPSNRFEALTGDRKGQYSIRINRRWRVCFEWIDNEPHNVAIVDYH